MTIPLRYTLLIRSAGFSQQSPYTALHFARALIACGHSLYRIFFYQDGVLNANALIISAQDETNIVYEWQTLARAHQVPLVLCSSAAVQRGILNQAEAERYEKSAANLAVEFSLGGLGQLIDAIQQTDRFISFGY